MTYRTQVLLLALAWPVLGSANLSVFPTRALITDKLKVFNLTLRHSGEKAQGYKMSLVYYPMKADGTLGEAITPSEKDRSAAKLLRFSPKRTILQPNLDQTVRVMLAGSKNLPDGDYRAHLFFQAQPTADTAEREVAEDKVSATVETLVSVAIPVVYRKGNPTYQVKLGKPKAAKTADKKNGIAVDILSSGKFFPYGQLAIFYRPASGGEEKQVGLVKGVSVYLPKITTVVPLTTALAPGGKLRVEFRESIDENPTLFATTEGNS